MIRRTAIRLVVLLAVCVAPWLARADLPDTIERIKPSIVVVGTFNKLRSPPFILRGTGFVVADGSLIATNAHVLPDPGKDPAEALMVLARVGNNPQPREVRLLQRDDDHDLAVLRLIGPPLPAMTLADAVTVREGQSIAFTGFPIGGALGFAPVTHRGILAAITPIALPGGNATELKDRSIRRLRTGSFPIYQLDATAYPGNSGGPLYDAETGSVIGIINMVFVKSTKEAVLEKPSGITYAIPAEHLRRLLNEVKP